VLNATSAFFNRPLAVRMPTVWQLLGPLRLRAFFLDKQSPLPKNFFYFAPTKEGDSRRRGSDLRDRQG
jgi:hypothetical protein